jgi:hypothetical protein
LERVLEPVSRAFNVESARAIVASRADDEVQARISALAMKCTEGALTEEEKREYETYVQAGNLISILQAKARLYLKKHGLS